MAHEKHKLTEVTERISHYEKLLSKLSDSDKDDQKRKTFLSLLKYWKGYKEKNYSVLLEQEKKRKSLSDRPNHNRTQIRNPDEDKSLIIPILTDFKRKMILRYSINNNVTDIDKIATALNIPTILVNRTMNIYRKKGHRLVRSESKQGLYFLFSKFKESETILNATEEENTLISVQILNINQRNFLKFLGFTFYDNH